ncbi:MAG TPA: hypothetical protein PKI92_02480 [Candidatus Woesebacteria bacterium]|nr:hypothetical protein [Candidatus Woesebacteria bacterium]HPR99537.1 hypothetical protein [Candidatus Woesebacteria bacterium]
MLLHQQAPTPEECQQPEGYCSQCKFFQRCREIVLKRFQGGKSIKEIEEEARRNSLGNLQWEGYSPDE